PATIFAIKPRPVAGEPAGGVVPAMPRARPESLVSVKPDVGMRSRADIITDIQRELSRRGLYDGPVDGVLGPKTDSAIRDFETSAKLKATGEPTEELLRTLMRAPAKVEAVAPKAARPDPIAELI